LHKARREIYNIPSQCLEWLDNGAFYSSQLVIFASTSGHTNLLVPVRSGLMIIVGLDQHTYFRSGRVSTGLSDIRGFDSRQHHLGIQPATLVNSAWPSLRGKVQWGQL